MGGSVSAFDVDSLAAQLCSAIDEKPHCSSNTILSRVGKKPSALAICTVYGNGAPPA